jgi:hypothetical protein
MPAGSSGRSTAWNKLGLVSNKIGGRGGDSFRAPAFYGALAASRREEVNYERRRP